MDEASESAVAAAVAAANRAAEAAASVYDAICEAPQVQEARQRRGLFGLGKYLVGDPTASDLDRCGIDLILGSIGIRGAVSLDDRMSTVHHLAQEGLTRPAPMPCRPLASTDDVSLCLALDAAALVRANIELAFSAANLAMAYEWAQEGDSGGERAIASRLSLDTHTPVGIALGATRIAVRVFLSQHRPKPYTPGAPDEQTADGYDAMFAAAASDVVRMMAATRSGTNYLTHDPMLSSEASYLAREIAKIAQSAATESSEPHDSALTPIGTVATVAADLAAETAEAYEAARKAM